MVSNKRPAGGVTSPMSVPITSNNPVNSSQLTKAIFTPTKLVVGKSESKYVETERVLCYEPDPTKVRVVYDAKILKVSENEPDSRGKSRGFQYLVHFQGWNASWDRYVPEEFLLKDTPENRLHQKQLFIEAEESRHLSSKIKKKKKKKKQRRGSSAPESSENCNDSSSQNSDPVSSNQDLRSSPKKKKKKKKDRKERRGSSSSPEGSSSSEPRIGKLIIVNGMAAIATSPPVTPTTFNSLRSSSISPSPKAVTPTPTRFPSPRPSPVIVPIPPSIKVEEEATVPKLIVTPRKRKLSEEGSVNRKLIKKRATTTTTTTTITTTILQPAFNATNNLIPAKPIEEKAKLAIIHTDGGTTTATTTNNSLKRRDSGCPTVILSDVLKRHLERDFEIVCKERKASIVPAEPNIVSVLEDFVRQYAAGRLVAYEKQQRKSMYTAFKRDSSEVTFLRALEAIQMCKEVAEGLRVLIDFNLQNSLLYANTAEPDQFDDAMRNGVMPNVPMENISNMCGPVIEVALINGNSPTASSGESAEGPTCLKRLRKSDVFDSQPTKRRPHINPSSRRTSCETMTTNVLGCTGASTRSSTASNKDGGGSSCSTTSCSTATNRTSLLMPPAATCPSTPQSNKVLRSVQTWRLLPQSVYSQTPAIPSLIYGPVHLLRLFVKLPEILARMHLPPKTVKLIVKYMDAVLEYFEGHPDLFSLQMYQ